VVLPVAPEIFVGVQFRGIRRKIFDSDESVEGIEELSDQPAV